MKLIVFICLPPCLHRALGVLTTPRCLCLTTVNIVSNTLHNYQRVTFSVKLILSILLHGYMSYASSYCRHTYIFIVVSPPQTLRVTSL